MINSTREWLETQFGKLIVGILKKKGMTEEEIQKILNDPYRIQQMAEAAMCVPP